MCVAIASWALSAGKPAAGAGLVTFAAESGMPPLVDSTSHVLLRKLHRDTLHEERRGS